MWLAKEYLISEKDIAKARHDYMIKVTATAPARRRGSDFPRKRKRKSKKKRFIDDEASCDESESKSELDLDSDLVDEEHAVNADWADDTSGTAAIRLRSRMVMKQLYLFIFQKNYKWGARKNVWGQGQNGKGTKKVARESELFLDEVYKSRLSTQKHKIGHGHFSCGLNPT